MYLAAMLRPVLPLAEYYANYDYITEELCKNRDKPILKCNGTCYVESLMKDANLLVDKNSHTATTFSNLMYFPIFILDDLVYKFSILIPLKELESPNYKKDFLIKKYIDTIYHPPEMA